jgi:hypothetical protein
MAMKTKEAAHECCDKMCAMTCCPCHLDIKKLKPQIGRASCRERVYENV